MPSPCRFSAAAAVVVSALLGCPASRTHVGPGPPDPPPAETGPQAAVSLPEGGRLAVLEIAGSDLPVEGRAYLSRKVRAAALAALGPGWEVMTRENMLALVDESQGQQVEEGTCEIGTFRNLGADLGVAGEVVRFAGRLRLTLSAYEVASGRLLRTAEVSGADEERLVADLPAGCARLFGVGTDEPDGSPPDPRDAAQRVHVTLTAPAPLVARVEDLVRHHPGLSLAPAKEHSDLVLTGQVDARAVSDIHGLFSTRASFHVRLLESGSGNRLATFAEDGFKGFGSSPEQAVQSAKAAAADRLYALIEKHLEGE